MDMGPREMKVEGQSRLTRRRGILKQNRMAGGVKICGMGERRVDRFVLHILNFKAQGRTTQRRIWS